MAMAMELEVVVVPVSDEDRAKDSTTPWDGLLGRATSALAANDFLTCLAEAFS